MLFGQIDLPEGGELPSAPTYETRDWDEVKAHWIDITHIAYPLGRRLFTFGLIDDGETCALSPGIPRPTCSVRSPWNHV